MSRVARRLPVLLVWAALVLVLTPLVQMAVSHTTWHRDLPQWGNNQGDWIIPWDFEERAKSADQDARYKYVDWPVGVLFLRNATINRVKADMQGGEAVGYSIGDSDEEKAACCGAMHGVMNENDLGNNGWHWREDRGMKTNFCAFKGDKYLWGEYNVLHYRVYAPARLFLFNQGMGQWIYGTTHIDHKECNHTEEWANPPYGKEGKWSGRSEKAEFWLARFGEIYFGRNHVIEDVIPMQNGEEHQDTGHWWENNGAATVIEVCLKNGGNPCLDSATTSGNAPPLSGTTTTLTIDQILHGSPGSISFHGRITANTGSWTASRTARIEFDRANIPGWRTDINLGVVTDSSGYFEYRDFGLDRGEWNIRARYNGNDEFSGSQTVPQWREVKRGYEIVARHTGHCLTLSEGWKNYNGQPFIQWPCSAGAGQVFSLWAPYGNGWYNIRANGYNRCLDVRGVSLADGAWIQQWDCYGAGQNNQIWRREPTGDGYYGLMPRHAWNAGLHKCLDVTGQSHADGVHIQQWGCWWGYNQRWFLRGVN